MPTAATGAVLYEPSWKWRPTTAWLGWARWAAGGESAEAVFRAMKSYLVGHDPARLEEMRFLIANPTASLYNNRTQILAALEFACLDILGQAWGVPVCEILGGRLRDRVPFAAYCFFRYPDPRTGGGEVRTIDQLVEHARSLKRRFGFTTHKLKGGVFPPDYELEAYRALAAAFPEDALRFDPNGVWSTEQAIRFGQAIEGLRNDYLEDPVFGLNGMRRTRQMVRVPLATNTVVVNFEQLAANALDTAVDVILLDTTFWGGIRACVKAAARVRDVSTGRRRSLLGRVGNPTGDHAASRRGSAEPLVRGRCPLPSFDGRHHRRRADAIRRRRHPRAREARAWASGSIATSCASTANFTSGWGAIHTTRIRGGRAGPRLFPTTAGPIRTTAGRRRSPAEIKGSGRWRRSRR